MHWWPVLLETDPRHCAGPRSELGSLLQPRVVQLPGFESFRLFADDWNFGVKILVPYSAPRAKWEQLDSWVASGNGTSNCWMKDASPSQKCGSATVTSCHFGKSMPQKDVAPCEVKQEKIENAAEWPKRQATCNGVSPLPSGRCGSAPSSSKRWALEFHFQTQSESVLNPWNPWNSF